MAALMALIDASLDDPGRVHRRRLVKRSAIMPMGAIRPTARRLGLMLRSAARTRSRSISACVTRSSLCDRWLTRMRSLPFRRKYM
eukprot:7255353-Prymnesium_polylepis.1